MAVLEGMCLPSYKNVERWVLRCALESVGHEVLINVSYCYLTGSPQRRFSRCETRVWRFDTNMHYGQHLY